MTAATESRVRTSASFVFDADEGALSAARLLRLFDQARRDLSLNVLQAAGAGAGYDGLQVYWPAIADVKSGDVIAVTAMRGAVRPRGHHVNYVATSGRRRCVVLAQADGWTLAPFGDRPSSDVSARARGGSHAG